MQADGLPFAVKFCLLLAIFALGFLLARDLFFIVNGSSHQKNNSYAAAVSSPAPNKAKEGKPVSGPSPTARSAESKGQLPEKTGDASTSLRQLPVENSPVENPTGVRPLELGNGSVKKSGPNAKPLRADEGTLSGGDLRTGTDAKPMGSLRGPGESGITGSLRPDERALPTGTLRSDEGSSPVGSLR